MTPDDLPRASETWKNLITNTQATIMGTCEFICNALAEQPSIPCVVYQVAEGEAKRTICRPLDEFMARFGKEGV